MKHILNVMVSVVSLAMDPVGNVLSILNNRASSTYKRAKTNKLPEMFAKSKIKLPEIFGLCLGTRSYIYTILCRLMFELGKVSLSC